MHNIGMKISLDTGDFVSNVGRAQQSIAGLTDEMKKAQKENRFDDFGRLSANRDRLQARVSGFERDIKTISTDPRIQTRDANGSIVLKLDPEYESLIKRQNEETRKIADDLLEARRGGNTGKIQSLAPLLEGKLYESQKTIQDIIKTGGDFSKRPAVENTPGPRDAKPEQPFPQNGDWRELKGLSGAITQEHDAGNWERVSRLGISKDALRGVMGEYDRDSRLEAKIKADPEFASQLKEIRDALKGMIAAIDEAAANGEYEKVDQLTGQAKQLQGISHKMIGDNLPSTEARSGAKAAQNALLNAISLQQITGAINTGIQTYVTNLDRSSIVNALGQGDAIGARIDELRREGAAQSGIGGSVGSIGGAIAGGLLSLIPGLQPFAPLLVSGGATLGNFVGGSFGLDENIEANKMATDEAKSKQWERQAPAAMELTGLLGKYGGSTQENTQSIRRTFENAANTATRYGFSPEEGMEQVKQAAYQGLDERQALDAARDVFAFERGTGADRGALAEFRNRTERFGGVSDGLNTAWRGSQASGVSPAQFNEYLRSMQKTFEDGIAKGFVRGTDEIAGNLAFLSDLNGGSELWKGEQGANRLSQMNAGVAATTGLASASDILSFRGAQNLLKQWDAEGDAKVRWDAIGDLDPKKNGMELRRGYDYIDAMAILERGLTPELFHSQMKMIKGVEGPGNRTGAVEQMKNIYGLNYTGSAALYQTYQDKLKTFNGNEKEADRYFSGKEWAKTLEDFKANPDYNNSTELTMFRHVADIQKYTQQIGQWNLDKKMPELFDSLKTSWIEAMKNGLTSDRGPGEHAPPDTRPASEEPPPPAQSGSPFPEEPPFDLKTASPQRLIEEAAAVRAQGNARLATNYEKEASVREMDMRDEITRKTEGATKYLFSEGAFGLGKEAPQMKAINETVKNAAQSRDPSLFNAAQEFSDIISRYGDENGFFDTRKYDKNNTFNSLADFSGDMINMLNALHGLVKEVESTAERVNKLEATLEIN